MSRAINPIKTTIISLLLISVGVHAQTICTWYHNASAAISMTFDDGSADQVSVAAPALEKNGWFGTFYLVTNWTTQYSPYKALAAKGHEIGAHSTAHQNYSTMAVSAVDADIVACNAKLQSEIGKKILTLAYPFCAIGTSEAAVKQHYIAARGGNTSINSGSAVWPEANKPANMWALGSATTDPFLADSAAKAVSRTMKPNGWLTELFHGITPIQTEFLKHVDFLATKKDSLFVAPFADVAMYINQRVAGKITTVSKTATVWTLTLTDTLDNAIYNRPVTIKATLPADWNTVTVTQSGATVWTKKTGTTLLLDAVPDKGEIVITGAGTGVMQRHSSVSRSESRGLAQGYSITGARLSSTIVQTSLMVVDSRGVMRVSAVNTPIR